MSFKLFDTSQRTRRPFEPMVDGKVSMYVCGLTVYDLPHIGHARTFIVFDVVRRYLTERGFEVTLVRNYTDVDDKIIRRAKELGEAPGVLSERMIDGLNEDMGALDVGRADIEPRVTTHIPQIVAMVETLIERGHAYEVEGDVYFRVNSFEGYGALSGRNLDELESGARVQVDARKEAPQDFALWKASKSADEPSWESPWGAGRPGWHIECSAMSSEHLGDTFDIHGGGRDLIFPHHENEIAQSKAACGGEFARYWMHTGMLEIEGEKMSHSLDNFWTIRDILKQVYPEALRYFFLTAHYRNSINFSRDAIQEAARRVSYLYRTLESLDEGVARRSDAAAEGDVERGEAIAALLPAFHEAMEDDFNTPRALASLAEAAKLANELAEQRKKPPEARVRAMRQLREVLVEMGRSVGMLARDPQEALDGLTRIEIKRREIDPTEIDALIEARTRARAEKDWAEADRLRDALDAKGVQVLDRPEGTIWRLS